MSISEGTVSDKSATPVDEGVVEDTYSHMEGVASVSTASVATSSFPEPTTDDVSPSLHAEVAHGTGNPHSILSCANQASQEVGRFPEEKGSV